MTSLHRTARTLDEVAWQLQSVAGRLARIAEAEELRSLAARGVDEIGAAHVRSIIAARRLWHACVGPAEADPAWALLMELLALRLEGSPIAVDALGEAAGLAPATAQRWIGRLRKSGLIARRPHPDDDRTILVALTDEAEDRLRIYLAGALRLSPWVL